MQGPDNHQKTEVLPDAAGWNRLYQKAGTPQNVIAHMQAVWAFLSELLQRLDPEETVWQHERLKNAALLHDILRTEPDHAQKGAELLAEEGFPQLARALRIEEAIFRLCPDSRISDNG